MTARRTRSRQWARRRSARIDGVQIQKVLPTIYQRLAAAGIPVSPLGELSRSSLTRLQRELRDATESPTVANDPQIQAFRKRLHLYLDH